MFENIGRLFSAITSPISLAVRTVTGAIGPAVMGAVGGFVVPWVDALAFRHDISWLKDATQWTMQNVLGGVKGRDGTYTVKVADAALEGAKWGGLAGGALTLGREVTNDVMEARANAEEGNEDVAMALQVGGTVLGAAVLGAGNKYAGDYFDIDIGDTANSVGKHVLPETLHEPLGIS